MNETLGYLEVIIHIMVTGAHHAERAARAAMTLYEAAENVCTASFEAAENASSQFTREGAAWKKFYADSDVAFGIKGHARAAAEGAAEAAWRLAFQDKDDEVAVQNYAYEMADILHKVAYRATVAGGIAYNAGIPTGDVFKDAKIADAFSKMLKDASMFML